MLPTVNHFLFRYNYNPTIIRFVTIIAYNTKKLKGIREIFFRCAENVFYELHLVFSLYIILDYLTNDLRI